MWTHGPRTDLYTSTERATVQRDLAKIFELLTVELLWSTSTATLGYTEYVLYSRKRASEGIAAVQRICFSKSRWKADSTYSSVLVSVSLLIIAKLLLIREKAGK